MCIRDRRTTAHRSSAGWSRRCTSAAASTPARPASAASRRSRDEEGRTKLAAVTALAAVRATRRARRDGGTERRRSVQKLAESVAIGPSGRARRSRGSAGTTARRSRASRAAAITDRVGPKPRRVLRRRGPRADGKAPASRPGATTPRAAERQALPVEHDGARRQHALGRRRRPGGERAAHGRAQPVVRAIYDRLDLGKIS